MPLSKEQLIKIHQKDAATPAALRRNPYTNYTEGYFHITMNVSKGAPLLCTISPAPAPPAAAPAPPAAAPVPPAPPAAAQGQQRRFIARPSSTPLPPAQVLLHPLGEAVLRAWHTVPSYYSCVEIVAFQVMPEHVHGLLYLKPGNTTHLGRIVQGFMIACTHNYWDVLGLDWRSKTSTPGRNNEYNDRDHTRSTRGPSLFVRGYNDVEALTPEQVATKIEYIRSNPERRLLKSQHRTAFAIHRDQKTPTWSVAAVQRALANDPFLSRHPLDRSAAYLRVQPRLHTAPLPAALSSAAHLLLDYVGSRALLAAPRKVCLVCHRADAALFDAQSAAVLAAARAGAVVVSAFISPRERTIRQQLLDEGLSLVEVMDNGFSDRYKPSAHALAACAAGRLLQITPWTYAYDRDTTISREMCLVMNELARLIAGTPDDWWKAPVRP